MALRRVEVLRNLAIRAPLLIQQSNFSSFPGFIDHFFIIGTRLVSNEERPKLQNYDLLVPEGVQLRCEDSFGKDAILTI